MKRQDIWDALITIRAPRSGDICVLLEPAHDDLSEVLTEHLKTLQGIFGGIAYKMIHITAQIFEPPPGGTLSQAEAELMRNLQSVAGQTQPFNVKADGFFPVHIDVDNLHVLKWYVEGTPALAHTLNQVDLAGVLAGMRSLYHRTRVCALVTALRDICDGKDHLLEQIPIPEPLFKAGKFSISRIREHNRFEKIGEVIF